MKIIKPYYEILDDLNQETMLKKIEYAGRKCYKSEDRIQEGSADKFIANIIKRGHGSVLEHYSFSVLFVCDRGVSHELVRHRLASYSQESTRYVNYSKDKYGREITVIEPSFFEKDTTNLSPYLMWKFACESAEAYYMGLLDSGCKPEEARSVLPHSVKTEIVVSANIREWRHILSLRTPHAAHPQIRELMIPLAKELAEKCPVLFGDILKEEV